MGEHCPLLHLFGFAPGDKGLKIAATTKEFTAFELHKQGDEGPNVCENLLNYDSCGLPIVKGILLL